MNTAITRESLGKLSDSQKYATDEAVTKTYAEQLREQGYSEKGTEHFVKESEANRTSPNAAVEHAVQLVEEMNTLNDQKTRVDQTSAASDINAQKRPVLMDTDITTKLQNKTAFSETELKSMDTSQLQSIIQTLSDDFAKSWKSAGLDPVTVDQQVSEMTRQSDNTELIKSAQIMQDELGFGEAFDAQSDGLQSDFEDVIMKSDSKEAKAAKKALITKIKYHPWTLQLKVSEKNTLFSIFENATAQELSVFHKNLDAMKGDFYAESDGAFYDADTKRITMNLLRVDARSKAVGYKSNVVTYFHEAGHLIDDTMHKKTTGKRLIDELPDLRSKLETDALNYVNRLLSENDPNYRKVDSFDKLSERQIDFINDDLWIYEDLKNGISDVFQGLTNHKIKGKYGHSKNPNYWNNPQALEKEAFAHMTEVMMIKGEKLDIFKVYFPESYRYFYKKIVELGEIK